MAAEVNLGERARLLPGPLGTSAVEGKKEAMLLSGATPAPLFSPRDFSGL